MGAYLVTCNATIRQLREHSSHGVDLLLHTTAMKDVLMQLPTFRGCCKVFGKLCSCRRAGRTLRGMVQKPSVMTKWGPLGPVPAYARCVDVGVPVVNDDVLLSHELFAGFGHHECAWVYCAPPCQLPPAAVARGG